VTASTIDARLEYSDPDDMVVCAGPVYHRVVFDIADEFVRPSARLIDR
jgi:hypothetical protein